MKLQPMLAPVSRRAFLGGTAVVAGAFSLTGCKKEGAAGTADGAENGTINYYIGNPPSIDPYNDQDVAGNMVARQLFDPLLTYDFTKDELTPCAAESWEANDAGDVFTFKIKQGNTFHNGETVDAAAFQRGWNRLCDPKTGNSPSVVSYYLKMVKGYDQMMDGSATELSGVSCPDDYTFQVELSEPFMDFPMICTVMCTSPVPEAALKDFDAYFKAPIGNGAYQMDGEWVDGQYINVKAYPDYKNGSAPKIANVHFVIQKDVETGFREFQAGNIDICDIPTAQVKEVEKQYGTSEDGYTITPGHQTWVGDQPSTYYLTLNLANDKLKDVNLRRAISLAINRESIVNTLFEGTRSVAGNLCPPRCSGYVADQWKYCHYDKDAAVKILDEHYPADASGSRGISLELTYNMDGSHKQVMESVCADLAQVGITVKQVTKEWAAVLSDYNAKDYQMGRTGWIAEYPSIDDFLYPLCYTGNSDNTSGYSNQQVDQLIEQARSTKDADERASLYDQANVLVGEDVPYVPLFFYRFSKVGADRIKQAYLTPIEVTSAASWELLA